MSIVCLHYDLKYIMGYVRVGVRLCIIDNHKYKATPVVTMGRLDDWFGRWQGHMNVSVAAVL